MKKVLAWGLALLMAGTLAGCGSGSGSPAPASTAVKAPAGTAAAPAGGASASGETFTLGLICPLSGSSAVSGQILKNATEMAVNEINEAGGIDGRIQIVLAEVDDEGVPANSVTAMQKLVEQDKVGGGYRRPGIFLHPGQHGDHQGGKDSPDHPGILQCGRDPERKSLHLPDDRHRRAAYAQHHEVHVRGKGGKVLCHPL